MTENYSQYKEKTYRMLRGLRKTNPEESQVDHKLSQFHVPEKRNRVLLPKYGQTVITHCPKGGEIRKKKVVRHEVLWLEYEEEEWDDNEEQNAAEGTAETMALIEKKYLDAVIRNQIVKQTQGLQYSVDEHHGLQKIYDSQSNYSSRTRLTIDDIGLFVKSTFTTGVNKLSEGLTNGYSRVIHSEEELLEIEAELFALLRGLLKIGSTDNCSPDLDLETKSAEDNDPNKVAGQSSMISTDNGIEVSDEKLNDTTLTDGIEDACNKTDEDIVNLQHLPREDANTQDTNTQDTNTQYANTQDANTQDTNTQYANTQDANTQDDGLRPTSVRNELTEANAMDDKQEPDDDDDDGFMGGIMGVFTRGQCDVTFVY